MKRIKPERLCIYKDLTEKTPPKLFLDNALNILNELAEYIKKKYLSRRRKTFAPKKISKD
jgi:hypothetical protein